MFRGEELERRVRAIVARLAKQPDPDALRPDVDLYRHLGIASSGALELLLSVEDELDVHLHDAEFNEARTIHDLVALIARDVHVAPAPDVHVSTASDVHVSTASDVHVSTAPDPRVSTARDVQPARPREGAL